MRKLSVFVTADALLAAVLLVWAQLWAVPFTQFWAKWYFLDKELQDSYLTIIESFDFNTGIGLAWTYVAVIFALVALGWIAWRSVTLEQLNETPDFSIVLFITSLTMTILNVGQSFVSISWKMFDPNSHIWMTTSKAPECLPWFFIGVVIAIFGISWWGICRIKKYRNTKVSWYKKYWPWIIYLGVVIGASIATVVIMWLNTYG